jgi:hypothetical protein
MIVEFRRLLEVIKSEGLDTIDNLTDEELINLGRS